MRIRNFSKNESSLVNNRFTVSSNRFKFGRSLNRRKAPRCPDIGNSSLSGTPGSCDLPVSGIPGSCNPRCPGYWGIATPGVPDTWQCNSLVSQTPGEVVNTRCPGHRGVAFLLFILFFKLQANATAFTTTINQ